MTSADRAGRESNLLPTFEQAAVREIVIAKGAAGEDRLVLRRNGKASDLHDYLLGEVEAPGENLPRGGSS